ncbi:MAG: SpaA isopeptide-forming pilin-related protein [Clostridium sp.]|nr:SpaA isopeptide-forming pilin-related protein [Clostridium sp.]
MKKCRRKIAMFMAVVIMLTAVAGSGSFVFAEDTGKADGQEPVLYVAEDRTDLDADEVAEAEDITVEKDSDYDVKDTTDGISYNPGKVRVSYYEGKGSFDLSKAGVYDTYYKAEPVSGKIPYLICRKVTIEETASTEMEQTEGQVTEADGEPVPVMVGEKADFEEYPLSDGEIESLQSNMAAMSIKLDSASAPVLRTAAKAKDSMKVAYSGYAKYCGHSTAIKYISESGDYYHHLVYCMDMHKNSTSGTVSETSGKVKAEITFCLVNGARSLGGTCHTSKYSSGSASADYFITSAAIHVLNGEVSLSYYNNGSGVYKNIAEMVSDAKKYDKSKYDSASGCTKSITYSISPKRTEWELVEDGLYRTKDKLVRTKSGTITNVVYKITGAPSGLTTGEIKTDASEIDDQADLKKYDICVAQTDADKASSNFYLYCNEEAMKKIQEKDSVIKIKANAYSDEKGGRKWTPTVVSQQKITFLEEFNVTDASATVKVTAKFQTGSLSLKKTNTYNGKAVAGATYYLYEDKECTDLLCAMDVTDSNGLAGSGVQTLTESTYYLKEVHEADGYKLDPTVYPIDISYFTIYDAAGKVTQKGKEVSVLEEPEPVGVMIRKTDSESGNIVAKAGFAVFTDQACTVRATIDGNAGGTQVPVFYYDEDLDMAASEKFVKMQDTYYVKEVEVPEGYRTNNEVIPVSPYYGEMASGSMENTPLRCDVEAEKRDRETGEAQGDAKLSGAVYGLYAAETINYPDGRGVVTYKGDDNITSTKGDGFQTYEVPANAGTLLASVATDESGSFNFGNLYFGNYYIKEISESEGYLLDDTVYDLKYREAENTHEDISLQRKVEEDVIKQPFEIIKVSTDGANEETDYVKGAEFTVKLQSEIDEKGWEEAKTYDVLVTDEKGYALSKELPYGTYLVKETKVPGELHKTKDFTVRVTEDSRTPQRWRVLNDGPFEAYIRFVKKDIETGKTVLLPNVTFKIKKADTDEYVEQKVGDKKISEFTTDETGTVTTPLKLKYGDYEVEEITAPEGYLVAEESFPFSVTKTGAVQVLEDGDGDAVIEVPVSNISVKGSISILKKGEVLAGAEYDTIIDRILTEVTGDDRSVTFHYEEQGLEGAVYNLIAVEDIYTPDHQTVEGGSRELAVIGGVPASAGAVVATLTTDENGEAEIDGLPLGKYRIEEVTAPEGYVLCKEAQEITLAYKDQNTEVIYGSAEFVNARVKTELSIVKHNSVNDVPVEGALYGVYALEDIVGTDGEILVEADSLTDTVRTDADGRGLFDADLPLGHYYVREIETAPGYLVDENEYPVDFTYQGQMTAVLTQEIEVKETPIIVEVSKTDITSGKELAGAKLEITDKDGNVYAEWVTDGRPYQLNAIPAGDYRLRETYAPYGYKIANEVEFTVEETGEIQKVSMTDERVKGRIEIYKTDKSNGKPIEGVVFEVRDKDGKVLATLKTDKKGYAETELLDIAVYNEDGSYKEDIPYTVVETKPTEGYQADDKKHEILLQYDDDAPDVVVYQLKVKNKPNKPKLPQTGGNYYPYIMGLAGVAVLGTGIFFYRRRRKRK